jgi:hypothetical protein
MKQAMILVPFSLTDHPAWDDTYVHLVIANIEALLHDDESICYETIDALVSDMDEFGEVDTTLYFNECSRLDKLSQEIYDELYLITKPFIKEYAHKDFYCHNVKSLANGMLIELSD